MSDSAQSLSLDETNAMRAKIGLKVSLLILIL